MQWYEFLIVSATVQLPIYVFIYAVWNRIRLYETFPAFETFAASFSSLVCVSKIAFYVNNHLDNDKSIERPESYYVNKINYYKSEICKLQADNSNNVDIDRLTAASGDTYTTHSLYKKMYHRMIMKSFIEEMVGNTAKFFGYEITSEIPYDTFNIIIDQIGYLLK